MEQKVCLIVGLDDAESRQIRERSDKRIVAHDLLPPILVQDGELWVEARHSSALLPVSKVVYHAIFADDLDFFAALALWGGPCLPSARGMMDCRLRLPCLIRALDTTRFPLPGRGYLSPHLNYLANGPTVAKWGNWHCGENKARFEGRWQSPEAALLEPFLEGQAVRLLVIGERAWQIRLAGPTWLKSIHAEGAAMMEIDPELVEDTKALGRAFGLAILASDYMIAADGKPYLLEVNHIPNVTRFPEVWEAYRDLVLSWL